MRQVVRPELCVLRWFREENTMSVTVRIPPPLRPLTGGADEIAVDGSTVTAALDSLEAKHPGLKERICDDRGVRRSVNLFVGDEDIRYLDGLATALKDGDVLSVVPAIAGG
jgi:molybdopterin synthase sulfur carrier subunit